MPDVNLAEPSLSIADLINAPERMIERSTEQMYSFPLEDQRRYQLEGARRRFAEQVEKIPVLRQLAQEQGIAELNAIEDLGPLLLPHSAYKSYPMSFLEQDRFDRITAWLNGFTTHDLSKLDARGCKSIDEWLQLMDAETPVRVIHSTGTSGKLSFLPRGTLEMDRMVTGWHRLFDRFGDERPRMGVPVEAAPTIFCQYRSGAMAQHRLLDWLQTSLYNGDASKIITTNPSRFSADAASVSGRLRVAEARGTLGSLQLSPALLARRDAFMADQKNAELYFDQFFERCMAYKGEPVCIMAHVPMLHNVALQGLKRGYENMFAETSFIQAGGGLKGQALPENFRETIDRFFGGAPLSDGYGMSEMVASTRACPQGHYHIPPWEIPFLLDPATGKQFPRMGTQSGRFACFDLNAETYWGGFVTGDAVTLSWGDTEPCGCGRIGPYVHRGIRRFSEQEGGDDKVTCAGAPEAHDNAINYLIQSMGV